MKKLNETRFKINSINDLIKLGEMNILTPQQYGEVVSKIQPFIGIFLNDYSESSEMAEKLKAHFETQYSERPLFIDLFYN